VAPSAARKPITISQVAERAGVSVTTVSHVLSGKRPVSLDTATRVRAAMDELGFVPNHAAKSLASGLTRTIGLVIPDISNPYFARLAKGVGDAADAAGFSVVMCDTDFDPSREARCLDVLRGRAIDGMVYAAGAPPSTRSLARLARAFPMAVADEELPDIDATSVVADNERGGELAGAYLRGLGHRAALYIRGPEALSTTKRRWDGFQRGFGPGRIDTCDGDYREASGYAAVAERLDPKARRFTAVFASNDLMAIGAMRAVLASGLRVPEDMSVMGFDDAAVAAYVRPALTTIHQPVYEIGHAAAEQLIGRIRRGGSAPIGRMKLDVTLIERETTGPADGATPDAGSPSDRVSLGSAR